MFTVYKLFVNAWTYHGKYETASAAVEAARSLHERGIKAIHIACFYDDPESDYNY